jgi:hypothetical protein
MKRVLVHKRFGREQNDVREFIRPHSPMVEKLGLAIERSSDSPREYLRRCHAFVCFRIAFPPGGASHQDWRAMEAFRFGRRPGLRYETTEYWAYPSETLVTRMGDCDDKSILLTSLLRRKFPAHAVHSTVGKLGTTWHMWTTVTDKGQVLIFETTRWQTPRKESTPYVPYFRFNDTDVQVLRHGGRWRG